MTRYCRCSCLLTALALFAIFTYVLIDFTLVQPSSRQSSQGQQIQIRQSNVPETERSQRIVLLAGPHKTASSSTQQSFYKWTAKPKVLHSWAWPVPPQVADFCSDYHESPEGSTQYFNKGFYPLVDALNGRKIIKKLRIEIK